MFFIFRGGMVTICFLIAVALFILGCIAMPALAIAVAIYIFLFMTGIAILFLVLNSMLNKQEEDRKKNRKM